MPSFIQHQTSSRLEDDKHMNSNVRPKDVRSKSDVSWIRVMPVPLETCKNMFEHVGERMFCKLLTRPKMLMKFTKKLLAASCTMGQLQPRLQGQRKGDILSSSAHTS